MHKKTHTLNNDHNITCTMVAVADLYMVPRHGFHGSPLLVESEVLMLDYNIIMEPSSLAKELRRLSCDLLNE